MQVVVSYQSSDPDVRRFLGELGFSDDEIARGRLTEDDCLAKKVNPYLLREISLLNEAYPDRFIEAVTDLVQDMPHAEVTFELEPDEASRGLLFLKESSYGMRHVLFGSDFCSESSTGKILYANLLSQTTGDDLDEKSHVVNRGVGVEKLCSANELEAFGFLREELNGVYFSLARAGDQLQNAAQAVVPVSSVWTNGEVQEDVFARGSAVVISPKGHVATACHVLFSEEGIMADDATLMIEGQVLSIKPEHVLYANSTNDVAILRIPELEKNKKQGWVQFSPYLPTQGMPLAAIGYPHVFGDDEGTLLEKTVTFGEYDVISMLSADAVQNDRTAWGPDREDEGAPFYLTTATTVPGSSGGGFFDDSGELLGITSVLMMSGEPDINGIKSFATPLLKEDVDDPRLVAVLEEVEAAQEGSLAYFRLKLRRSPFLRSLKSFLGIGAGQAQ